jgi:hypothetical protein
VGACLHQSVRHRQLSRRGRSAPQLGLDDVNYFFWPRHLDNCFACNCMRLHAFACDHMQLHAATCDCMQLHATACGHIRMHATAPRSPLARNPSRLPTTPQLQLLLASLLAVATHLEDPFASPHPDALSLSEARDSLGFVSVKEEAKQRPFHGPAPLPRVLGPRRTPPSSHVGPADAASTGGPGELVALHAPRVTRLTSPSDPAPLAVV